MGRINYYINGVSLRNYGLFVSSAKKLISLPARKEGVSHSYDNEHGNSVDVLPFVKERKITLSCFTDKISHGNYMQVINDLYSMILSNGMFQLEVEFEGSSKRLSYWCYVSGEIDVKTKYVGGKSFGTFDLVLTEPCPMKRVYKVVTTSANQEIELDFSDGDDKYYTVIWGDGKITENVTVGQYPTHIYTTSGTYRVMVVGDVNNLTIDESGDTDMTIELEWNQSL